MSGVWLVTALLSALFIASSNVVSRVSYNRHGGFWEVFYTSSVVNLLLALPLLFISFRAYGIPTTKELLVSLGFGLVSSTFSSVLFAYSVRECGAVVSGSASLSVEPATATLLGALVVGEKVGYNLIVAVAMFPLIAYLLYRGGRHAKTFESCGKKSFIGVFTGAWASVSGVLFSYLVSIGLAVNPVFFYVSGLLVRLVVFFPFIVKNGIGPSVFREVPKILYLASLFSTLGLASKMVSLSYSMPAHSLSLVLLYPAITVVLSHVVKEADEPLNRYTVSAVLISTAVGLLVSSS